MRCSSGVKEDQKRSYTQVKLSMLGTEVANKTPFPLTLGRSVCPVGTG